MDASFIILAGSCALRLEENMNFGENGSSHHRIHALVNDYLCLFCLILLELSTSLITRIILALRLNQCVSIQRV